MLIKYYSHLVTLLATLAKFMTDLSCRKLCFANVAEISRKMDRLA